MFENRFQKKPMQQQRPIKDNCKIKIKNTSTGRVLEFQGNCSKEQLSMAKMNLMNNEEFEED